MGAFLDKPKVEKENKGGSGNGIRYGLSSMQGWRVEMEDAHCSCLSVPLPGLEDWSFFAVFDGHAGEGVSAYCAQELLNYITSNSDFSGSTNNVVTKLAPTKEMVITGLRTGFLTLDDRLRNVPDLLSGKDKSGSTATSAMISPTTIFFANCGDSRVILTRSGSVFFSTQDHKPINPTEKERIQNAGGSVMVQRVNGSLAVSRALGDFEYKNVQGKGQCEQLVSPEPEVYAIDRTLDDEFITLACDGIWDVMTNEELSSFITSRMKITDDLENICNQVVETCLHKGSRDNMSIVIVALQEAPHVSEEAIKAEEELDKRLQEKVKEIMEDTEVTPRGSQATETDVRCVLNALSEQNIQGLPPGGGLYAKYSLLESIVKSVSSTPNNTEPKNSEVTNNSTDSSH